MYLNATSFSTFLLGARTPSVCMFVCVHRVSWWSLNVIYRKMKQRNLPAAVPDKGEPLTRQRPGLPAAPSTSEMKGENTCLEDKEHPKTLASPRKENLLPVNSKAGVFFSPLSHHVAFRPM